MTTRATKTFGAVQAIAAAGVAVVGLVFVSVASLPRHTASNTTLLRPQPQAQVVPARAYLGIVGLTPEALAAAGVTPQQAARVMVNFQSHMDAGGAGLQGTIDTWGAANQAADRAQRAVQSSKGRVDDLDAADAALTSAAAAKQSAINTAFSAAVAELDGAVADTLVRIRNNKCQSVPVQYLVVDRTGRQWRQLRDALSQKQIMLKRGEPLDEFNANIITQADNDPAVMNAANALANNLQAVTQAVSGEGQVP